jgi:hypothetical protein
MLAAMRRASSRVGRAATCARAAVRGLLGIRVTDKDNVPRGTLLLSVTHGDYAHTPWGRDYLFAVRFNVCACCDTPFSPAATLFMVPR